MTGKLCPFPQRGHKDFVVLASNGIHNIGLDFCGCAGAPSHHLQLLKVGWWPSTPLHPQTAATMSVLRFFHINNLQGQVTPKDFYRTLEQMSSSNGLTNPPVSIAIMRRQTALLANYSKDRLAQWMLMVREWRHMKMVKRAGRAHDPTGINGTPQGGLSIACRACPHPNINLPQD